jgi:hypothetical protein
MFEAIEIGDSVIELQQKLMRNTDKMVAIQAEYNEVQKWINEAIAIVYVDILEKAKKKPDTQGIR